MFYNFIFEKEIPLKNPDVLLDAFEKNFQRTVCYHTIKRKDNRIDLDNNPFDFNYSYKLTSGSNLWHGLGDMYISITPTPLQDLYKVKFSVSLLRVLILQAIFLIVISIILTNASTTYHLYLLFFFIIVTITSYISGYIRIRRFFNDTIKIGDFYRNQVNKSYDWDVVLQNKTNSELKQIIKGKTLLPNIVIELAKKEMVKRGE